MRQLGGAGAQLALDDHPVRWKRQRCKRNGNMGSGAHTPHASRSTSPSPGSNQRLSAPPNSSSSTHLYSFRSIGAKARTMCQPALSIATGTCRQGVHVGVRSVPNEPKAGSVRSQHHANPARQRAHIPATNQQPLPPTCCSGMRASREAESRWYCGYSSSCGEGASLPRPPPSTCATAAITPPGSHIRPCTCGGAAE